MRIIFILLWLPFSVYADDYGSITISRVESVYDGDTFHADIDHWPGIIGNDVGVRINGIDTPELRGQADEVELLGKIARAAVVDNLLSATKVEVDDIERGKYFRIVGDVYADDVNIAGFLVSQRLAKWYDGTGARPKWSVDDLQTYLTTANRIYIPIESAREYTFSDGMRGIKVDYMLSKELYSGQNINVRIKFLKNFQKSWKLESLPAYVGGGELGVLPGTLPPFVPNNLDPDDPELVVLLRKIKGNVVLSLRIIPRFAVEEDMIKRAVGLSKDRIILSFEPLN